MAEPTQIAIVTPALACDKFLLETLDSVENAMLNVSSYRHVIVGPACVLPGVRDRNVVFLEESSDTDGVFSAVSQGFEFACRQFQPTWITYINGDDVLLPGFGEMIAHMHSSSAGVHFGRVRWLDSEGAAVSVVPIWPFSAGRALLFEAGIAPLTQQGLCLRASVWKESGGFCGDLKLTADSELFYRLTRNNVRFAYAGRFVAGYRMREGQLSSDQSRVVNEHARWVGRADGPMRRIARYVCIALFRSWFIRVYAARMMRGHIMFTRSAMRRGGFK